MTSLNEKARDNEGRSYLAPAWSGDINTLTADQLHHRIEALGSHIGRLSTRYVPDSEGGDWRVQPNLNRAAATWIVQRLECLRRLDELQAEDVSCTCGTPETYSLNPAEVVTHRTDGPCTVGPAAEVSS